jgi:hypothetical protein
MHLAFSLAAQVEVWHTATRIPVPYPHPPLVRGSLVEQQRELGITTQGQVVVVARVRQGATHTRQPALGGLVDVAAPLTLRAQPSGMAVVVAAATHTPAPVLPSVAVRAGAAAAALEKIPPGIMVMSLLQPPLGHLTRGGAGVVLMGMLLQEQGARGL